MGFGLFCGEGKRADGWKAEKGQAEIMRHPGNHHNRASQGTIADSARGQLPSVPTNCHIPEAASPSHYRGKKQQQVLWR